MSGLRTAPSSTGVNEWIARWSTRPRSATATAMVARTRSQWGRWKRRSSAIRSTRGRRRVTTENTRGLWRERFRSTSSRVTVAQIDCAPNRRATLSSERERSRVPASVGGEQVRVLREELLVAFRDLVAAVLARHDDGPAA
jgi:hypothetical protein